MPMERLLIPVFLACSIVMHLLCLYTAIDIHPGNMLLGIDDDSMLQRLEEREFSSPVPRKVVSATRTIYLSCAMRPDIGPMLLADFGEARIGPGPHAGDIMPLGYRAPETLHYFGWSYPVDSWSIGLTVCHLVFTPIFSWTKSIYRLGIP